MTAPPAQDARLRGEPVARAVFADLPARYDRLAYLLSFGQDRRWRRAVVGRTAAGQPGLVLDVATGPAGIALAVADRTGADVVGVDLNEPMLRAGVARTRRPGRAAGSGWPSAGPTSCRSPDATFDAVTLLLPAALRGRPGRDRRRDGPLPAPRRHAGQPGVPRAAAARLAGRLVAATPGWRCRCSAGSPAAPPGTGSAGSSGPSISSHYRQHPLDEHIAAWQAAGLTDVGVSMMSLGGGLIMWGRKAARPRDPVRERPDREGQQDAFYALGRGTGGFRDWLTLLHPPYTLWHLSYVAIGAALMPHLVLWRLGGDAAGVLPRGGHRRARPG